MSGIDLKPILRGGDYLNGDRDEAMELSDSFVDRSSFLARWRLPVSLQVRELVLLADIFLVELLESCGLVLKLLVFFFFSYSQLMWR
jgi:hypothetical protein